MSSFPVKPAALEFTEQELGGPCTESESSPVATTTAGVVVNGAGDRVGLLIMNLGANNVNIGFAGSVTANTGILLPGNGGFISMSVRDDFTLPTRQFSAISTGGNAQLYVLEIIRYRNQPTGGN